MTSPNEQRPSIKRMDTIIFITVSRLPFDTYQKQHIENGGYEQQAPSTGRVSVNLITRGNVKMRSVGGLSVAVGALKP